MPEQTIAKRVETLEFQVSELSQLPARMTAVEGQILQLREEMHGEFSAVRAEMRVLNAETTAEMRALNEETKAQLLTLHEEVLDRISKIGECRPARKRGR